MTPGEMLTTLYAKQGLLERDDRTFIEKTFFGTDKGTETRALSPFQLIWIMEIYERMSGGFMDQG